MPGMQKHYAALAAGAAPLDIAIEVVKIVEADPNDHSVGLGGLPNERGVVQLDAACMHAPTHNSGAVAAIENILHPSEVARLVMERRLGEGAGQRLLNWNGKPVGSGNRGAVLSAPALSPFTLVLNELGKGRERQVGR